MSDAQETLRDALVTMTRVCHAEPMSNRDVPFAALRYVVDAFTARIDAGDLSGFPTDYPVDPEERKLVVAERSADAVLWTVSGLPGCDATREELVKMALEIQTIEN